MNEEKIVTAMREKGPAFVFGAILGAAVITAFVNRDKIVKAINQALGRNQQSVVKHEYSERS